MAWTSLTLRRSVVADSAACAIDPLRRSRPNSRRSSHVDPHRTTDHARSDHLKSLRGATLLVCVFSSSDRPNQGTRPASPCGRYRADWLRYARDWVRETDPGGHLERTGVRVTPKAPLPASRKFL